MSMLTDTDLTDHDPTGPGQATSVPDAQTADRPDQPPPPAGHREPGCWAWPPSASASAPPPSSGAPVGDTEAASVVVVAGESVPVDPGATVTVRLMNADGSFSGQADAKRYGPV